LNQRKGIAVLIVLLLLAVSYWVYNEYFTEKESVLEASGTIEATTIDLNAKIYGTIKSFPISEGDTVQAGQLIAEISRNDLLAQKERDALGVKAAEAQLEDLAAGPRLQEIKQAISSLEAARSIYEKSTNDLDRVEQLHAQGAISLEEVEQARLNQELQKKQLEIAESKLKLLESGNRPQSIATAAAELERSRAVLKTSEALVEDLKIYSPLKGTISNKNYEEGEYVSIGASLAAVADLEHLWIKVYIPTDDLPAVKLGQIAQLTVSGSERVFAGTVEEIASQGEFTPKTIQTKKERTNVVFAVKLTVANEDGILKPGMPADLVFDRGN